MVKERFSEKEQAKHLEQVLKYLDDAKYFQEDSQIALPSFNIDRRAYKVENLVLDGLVYMTYPTPENEKTFLNGIITCLNKNLVQNSETNLLISDLKFHYQDHLFSDLNEAPSDYIEPLTSHLLVTHIDNREQRLALVENACKIAVDMIMEDTNDDVDCRNQCLKAASDAHMKLRAIAI